MNGRNVSTALSALPEDMVAEAMEPGNGRRGFSWLRLAACLTVIVGLCFGFWPAQSEIVTAPGLLTVTVYAMDENSDTGVTEIELEAGVNSLIDFSWNFGLSRYPGLPIELLFESDDFLSDEITFEVSVSNGKYFVWGEHTAFRFLYLPSEFVLRNDTVIYWSPAVDDEYLLPEFDHIYTNIVIRCGDHIVGYAMIRYDRSSDPALSDTFEPFLVESIMFPKINGEYQNISYEYVRSIFNELERE